MIRHAVRSKSGGTKEVLLTPIKAIRYQCLECMGWSALDVRNCSGKFCSLYPYRLGTNPERKGIGNSSAKSPAELKKKDQEQRKMAMM